MRWVGIATISRPSSNWRIEHPLMDTMPPSVKFARAIRLCDRRPGSSRRIYTSLISIIAVDASTAVAFL